MSVDERIRLRIAHQYRLLGGHEPGAQIALSPVFIDKGDAIETLQTGLPHLFGPVEIVLAGDAVKELHASAASPHRRLIPGVRRHNQIPTPPRRCGASYQGVRLTIGRERFTHAVSLLGAECNRDARISGERRPDRA